MSSAHGYTFPTGTKFYGLTNNLGMQSFGNYVYPDGTKYLGHFHNSLFHGSGFIKFPEPYSVCFSVEHNHGKLTKITKISFDDELRVGFKMDDSLEHMSFKNWRYCTAKDRRFQGEIRKQDMEAVGPTKYQTAEGPNPPPLNRNIFDLGFGKFDKYRILTDMPDYMNPKRSCYLGCREVRRWIYENCRHGKLEGVHLKQEVQAKFARQIMANNLANNVYAKCHRPKALQSLPKHELQLCPDSASSHKDLINGLDKFSLSYTSIIDNVTKHEPTPKCTQGRVKPKQQQVLSKMVEEVGVCHIN